MFCPQCGAEYREGIDECADCEVALVAEPPVAEHPEPDLVEVLETTDPALLPVVVSLFESAGIDAFIEGDEIMGVLPLGEFGGLRWSGDGRGLSVLVKVPREQAEEAQQLLEAVEEGGEGDGD